MQSHTQQQITTSIWKPAAFHAAFCAQIKAFTFSFPNCSSNHFYLTISSREEALAGFIKAEETPHDYYVNYIEVLPKHRGQRLSHLLLERLFRMAADTDRAILMSAYTPMGGERLARQVERLQRNFPALCLGYEQHA